MKAMLLNEYGENARFTEAKIPRPQLQTGHVLVQVAASSVNTVDTMIQTMGDALPLSPPTPAILGMISPAPLKPLAKGQRFCRGR